MFVSRINARAVVTDMGLRVSYPHHTMFDDVVSIRLSAQDSKPLADHPVRGAVVAAAQALAEREGIKIERLTTDDDGISIDLVTQEATAVGFAAELRRITNHWYEEKYGKGPLWRKAK